MNEFLISIIVPVYNVEKYVAECIESIMKQTYQNIQIILVNDGSTDQSGAICDKYATLDQRIEVIHQPNKGLVAARKSGLRIAKGEYIGFVDGDDYIDPNMYERLYDEIIKSNADFVNSGFWWNNEKRSLCVKSVVDFTKKWEKEEFLKKTVFENSYLPPSICTKLFKTNLIKESYQKVPDDSPYGEDLINLCVCVMESKRIGLLDNAYYYYRDRDDSMTHATELGDCIYVLRLYDGLCNILLDYGCYEKFKGLINDYVYRILEIRMIHLFNNDFQLARYYYGHTDELQGKRIAIYGAGIVGKDYYAQISRFTDCEIVAWVDMKPDKYKFPYIKLYGVDILDNLDFDLLIIAVKRKILAEEICDQLIDRGIERDKIFWSEPRMYNNVN